MERLPGFRLSPDVAVQTLSTKLSTGWLGSGRRGLLRLLLLGAMASAFAAPEVSSIGQLIKEANAGDPWAQLNLGAAYDNGMGGLGLDPVQAVRWYRRAAEAGLAEAQFNLAHCLATGSGTPRSDNEALQWMLRAAGQGLASAQYLAGVMLAEGIGTQADPARAIVWLERAIQGGHLEAASLLQRLQSTSAE